MKIEYGSETLGDDNAGDFITPALGRSHQRLVQPEPLLGAPNAATFNRQNARNDITFIIEKQHASLAAAKTHAVAYPDSLPATAALRITESTTAHQIADACLVSVELVGLTGRSTAMKYTFTGGAITESL